MLRRRCGTLVLVALILALTGCTSSTPISPSTAPSGRTSTPSPAPRITPPGPGATPSPTPSMPTPTASPTTMPGATPTPTASPISSPVRLVINGGRSSFTDPRLALAIETVSAIAVSFEAMRFSWDGGSTWTAWAPYAASTSLTLPGSAGYGQYSVQVEVRRATGDIETASATARYVSADRASMSLISSYRLQAALDYGRGRIAVTETITLTNTSGGLLSKLNLATPPQAFGEFALGGVEGDGFKVTAHWSNNDNLAVNLGHNVRPGESFSVTITFTDTARSDISSSLAARLSKANGIMQVSQWFPIISDGHALRYPGDSQFTAAADSFRLELTFDPGLVVAAPGKVIASSSTTRVVELGPARDFAFAVSPEYKRATDSVDGVEVQTYYLAGTAGATALSKARAALHEYDARFGAYPYTTFVVAQATRPGAGNEYPGIIFVGSANLGSTNVLRHETSHQWFYGLLGDDQIQSPWLDEAFAQWAGDGYVSHAYCSSKPVSSPITAFRDVPADQTDGVCGSYDQTVYFKGATLIAGVRTRMGDAAFFASLRQLVIDHRFGIITTAIVADNWLAWTGKSERVTLKAYLRQFLDW